MLWRIFLILSIVGISANASDVLASDALESVSKSIVSICDKPENAGAYWNVTVKADGGAMIGFKVGAGGNVKGDVELTKTEWTNVVKTIEDTKDYRECAKELTPKILDKVTVVSGKQDTKRTLSGVSWVRFVAGVNVKLKACDRKGETIECQLVLTSGDKDLYFSIFSSSTAYDQRGYKFSVSQIGIADQIRNGNVNALLIKGIETKAFIRFKKFTKNSTMISKMQLNVGTTSVENIDFRDIKIPIK